MAGEDNTWLVAARDTVTPARVVVVTGTGGCRGRGLNVKRLASCGPEPMMLGCHTSLDISRSIDISFRMLDGCPWARCVSHGLCQGAP